MLSLLTPLPNPKEKTCPACKQLFQPVSSAQKFCSPKCILADYAPFYGIFPEDIK